MLHHFGRHIVIWISNHGILNRAVKLFVCENNQVDTELEKTDTFCFGSAGSSTQLDHQAVYQIAQFVNSKMRFQYSASLHVLQGFAYRFNWMLVMSFLFLVGVRCLYPQRNVGTNWIPQGWIVPASIHMPQQRNMEALCITVLIIN